MERGVLVERPISPQLIVVGSILRQNSTQLRFTKNDYMVDALAPDRSDQPFSEGVLPRRGWGDGLITDTEKPHPGNGAGNSGLVWSNYQVVWVQAALNETGRAGGRCKRLKPWERSVGWHRCSKSAVSLPEFVLKAIGYQRPARLRFQWLIVPPPLCRT
jgi:hypothetical protein